MSRTIRMGSAAASDTFDPTMNDTAYTTMQDGPSESFDTLQENKRMEPNLGSDIRKGKRYIKPYLIKQRMMLKRDLDLSLKMQDEEPFKSPKNLNQISVPFRSL